MLRALTLLLVVGLAACNTASPPPMASGGTPSAGPASGSTGGMGSGGMGGGGMGGGGGRGGY